MCVCVPIFAMVPRQQETQPKLLWDILRESIANIPIKKSLALKKSVRTGAISLPRLVVKGGPFDR